MAPATECWGQPPISCYAVNVVENDSVYAAAFCDPYVDINCYNAARTDTIISAQEDAEDMMVFARNKDDSLIPWGQVREELMKDGLL